MLKKLEGKSFLFHDQIIWKGYPSNFMITNLEGKGNSFQIIKDTLEGKPSILIENEAQSWIQNLCIVRSEQNL